MVEPRASNEYIVNRFYENNIRYNAKQMLLLYYKMLPTTVKQNSEIF